MLTFCMMLCLTTAAPAPAAPQELPTYFIKLIQERTLFASNESAVVTVRLGNQLESILKTRKFPHIVEALQVYQGDTPLERDPEYTSKELFKRAHNLGYGAHKDFRINLKHYFPAMAKGGVFRVSYTDDHFELQGKTLSILNVPMPDLDKDYLVATSMGDFTIRLDPVQVPNHARNFALLVATQFYRDMLIHRVERNSLFQTGDPLGDGTGGSGFTVGLEKSPFLRHVKYAVGMARKQDLDSADSQFYVCLEELKMLDDGYTAVGRVVSGFEVVDAIGKVPTTPPGAEPPSRPIQDVLLYSVTAVPRAD